MPHQTTTIPPVPNRPANSHKGTFGTVIVIGGSRTMIGAPALTATAAFRTGCGLVKILTLPDILPHCLTIQPSATGIPIPYLDHPEQIDETLDQLPSQTVLAVGPGMSVSPAAQRIVSTILHHHHPTVLDADGLNNLAKLGTLPTPPRCPLVLTPHPGEFRRLAQAASINLDPTDPDQRPDAAAQLAQRYHAIAVLKGTRTVVSDGERYYINTTGNPALATAGTGDVLTGAIASLIAQSMPPFDAAVLAVHLHGLAADLWAARHSPAGMLATDAANWLPHALAEHHK